MTKRVLKYETEDMHKMRVLLRSQGHTDEQIDNFKSCLIQLEKAGFSISGPQL